MQTYYNKYSNGNNNKKIITDDIPCNKGMKNTIQQNLV